MRTHDPLHHPHPPPHTHTTTRRPATYTSTEGRGAVAAHVARPGEAVTAVVARAHPPLAVFRDLEPEALLVVHLGAVAMVEVTGYHHATWHKQKQGHSLGTRAEPLCHDHRGVLTVLAAETDVLRFMLWRTAVEHGVVRRAGSAAAIQ